jgi:hypothetical protein
MNWLLINPQEGRHKEGNWNWCKHSKEITAERQKLGGYIKEDKERHGC